MFHRVASYVAGADLKYDENADIKSLTGKFYQLMAGMDFLPNSPTLMNAGTTMNQLSACFVLPVQDSVEGIFNSIKYMALIHKSGGELVFHFQNSDPQETWFKPPSE